MFPTTKQTNENSPMSGAFELDVGELSRGLIGWDCILESKLKAESMTENHFGAGIPQTI